LRFWHRRREPPLAVDVYGHGRALLLLHGQPGAASDWRAVAEDLAADFRVIVPDRLGYGRTGGKAGGFAVNARAVVRLMGRLGERRALLVGHSWAGGVALQGALDFPSSVAGVGLVSPVVPDEPPSRTDRLLAKPLFGTAVASVLLGTAGRLIASSAGSAAVGRQLQGHEEVAAALGALGASWHHPSAWRSFAIEQRALVEELGLLTARLDGLRAPVAVVVGSADRVIGTEAARRLATEIAGASLEVIPGAGHLLPQLKPASVATMVRALAERAAWP